MIKTTYIAAATLKSSTTGGIPDEVNYVICIIFFLVWTTAAASTLINYCRRKNK